MVGKRFSAAARKIVGNGFEVVSMDSECRVYYVEHKDRIVLQEVLILGGEIRLEKLTYSHV